MADEVVAAPVVADAPAAEPAPSEPSGKPKAGTPELARWHATRAQAQIAKEEGLPPPETNGMPPKDPVTGKFLKRGQKATTVDAAQVDSTQPKTAAPIPKPKADDSKVPDSLAAVRRIAGEGKVLEAVERALGRPLDEVVNSKAFESLRHETKVARSKVAEERAVVERQSQQLREIHQELSREYAPYAAGKKAFEAGDFEEAFRQWTGEDLNSFQRKALRQMTNPGVGKDPAILQLQQQNVALQQQIQQFINGQSEQQKQAEIERRSNDYRNSMVTSLEQSDDPAIAAAAKNPKFQQRVWDTLAAHYDKASDATIPFAEAAELARDAILAEQQELGGVFTPVPSGQPRTSPARAATPAKPTARAVTTLSQKEAAEAAAQPKLKGKALMDHYIRLGNEMIAKQNGIG